MEPTVAEPDSEGLLDEVIRLRCGDITEAFKSNLKAYTIHLWSSTLIYSDTKDKLLGETDQTSGAYTLTNAVIKCIKSQRNPQKTHSVSEFFKILTKEHNFPLAEEMRTWLHSRNVVVTYCSKGEPASTPGEYSDEVSKPYYNYQTLTKSEFNYDSKTTEFSQQPKHIYNPTQTQESQAGRSDLQQSQQLIEQIRLLKENFNLKFQVVEANLKKIEEQLMKEIARQTEFHLKVEKEVEELRHHQQEYEKKTNSKIEEKQRRQEEDYTKLFEVRTSASWNEGTCSNYSNKE